MEFRLRDVIWIVSSVWCCLILCQTSVSAQANYFVYFTDKAATSFDPHAYFDQKAIDRRIRQGLPLYDMSDLPVNPAYVQAVQSRVLRLRHILRWPNAVSITATPGQLGHLRKLDFIKEIHPFSACGKQLSHFPENKPNPRFDTLLSQTRELMQLDVLEANGWTGKDVRVAILDAGFKGADTHPSLDHVRKAGRIFATRDFYDGDEDVYHHSRHGTQVMSCIAGIYEGRQLGCAKDAGFLLARTESENKEPAIEEDHWLAAAEWADKLGADILNSSLTYTHKRYTYEDMDGITAPVSRAAAMASRKGILVVCSMGNDGADKWKYLGAPADVPEVLSVGGSLPMMPQRIRFASWGPNAKGQLKPDISAPAFVVTANKGTKYTVSAGTSFSSPLIAGLAACILQRYPDRSRQFVFETILEMGHYFPYFDYEIGHGVPDVRRWLNDSLWTQNTPSFEVQFFQDTVVLKMNPEVMADSATYPFGRMLFYHLEQNGKLEASFQIPLPNRTRYYYFVRQKKSRGTLRIWFARYLWEQKLEE